MGVAGLVVGVFRSGSGREDELSRGSAARRSRRDGRGRASACLLEFGEVGDLASDAARGVIIRLSDDILPFTISLLILGPSLNLFERVVVGVMV